MEARTSATPTTDATASTTTQAIGALVAPMAPVAPDATSMGKAPTGATDATRCFLCAFTPRQPCQVASVEGRLARVVERAVADGAPLVTLIGAHGQPRDILLTRDERALASALAALAPAQLQALTVRAFHLMRRAPIAAPQLADVAPSRGDDSAHDESDPSAAGGADVPPTPAPRLTLQATPLSVIVIEPDLQLNITDINNAEYCVRQYPLRRMAPSTPTMPTLRGTIIHQAFKELLKSGRSAPDEVAASLAQAVQAQAADLALRQITADAVTAEAEPHLRALAQWYRHQRHNLWGSVPDIRTETFLLAPEVGLKGRLDALLSDAQGDALLELKTGQSVFNLPKREHRWQVYGYQTLLAVRRPNDPSRPGATLLYSGTPGQAEAHMIPFMPRDLRRVIALRNQLALTHATGVVPPPPGGAKCARCSMRETCQRASALLGWQAPPDEGPAQAGKPATLPPPIDPDDAAWFARMYELMRLEAQAAEAQSATLWRLTPDERCAAGIALGDLEPAGEPQLTASGEWEYTFHCEQTSDLREGDAVLLSDGDPIHGEIVTGSILSIGQRHVTVWAPERISKPRLLDRYASDIVHDRTVRNLWRWLDVDPRLRALVAGRRAPEFGDAQAYRWSPDRRVPQTRAGLETSGTPEVTRRTRGYLPHLERTGATYFVTFRLADSLPQRVLQQYDAERQMILAKVNPTTPEAFAANERYMQRIERYLDAGAGSRVLANPKIATMVANTLRHFDGDRYQLFAWCVMPNHVHVVFQPVEGHALNEIVRSWKIHTSRETHHIAGSDGQLWQREYHDHLIRDDADYQRIVAYVVGNPAKAGLEDWPWVEGPDELVARGISSAAMGTVSEETAPTHATDAASEAYRWSPDRRVPQTRAGLETSGTPVLPIPAAFNPEQRLAVERALTARDFLLAQGPPGTGKTSVVAEIARQAIARGERVLLAAFTNQAVDNALRRLLAGGVSDFVRLGHGLSVAPDIHPYRLSERARAMARHAQPGANDLSAAGNDPLTALGQQVGAAPSGVTDDALSPAHLRATLLRAPLVATTTATWSAERYDDVGDPLRFDLAIIDEATQLTTPALLGALRFASRFVLVGDERQLPPLVMSEAATEQGLKRSLFSELQERWGDIASVALRRQYRMHPVICDFPSQEFYEGALVAEGAARAATLDLPFDPSGPLALILDPQKPLVFVDTPPDGADSGTIRGKLSATQAKAACRIVLALRVAGLPAARIGVIAPYRAQVAAIRQRLAADGETGVAVDTVDRFQGGEREVILFSFGGDAPMGLPGGHGRDFLADPQRLNVALTRAQRKLILLGDRQRLEGFPLLKRLIAYCDGLYGGRGGVVAARHG